MNLTIEVDDVLAVEKVMKEVSSLRRQLSRGNHRRQLSRGNHVLLGLEAGHE